jgi:hypothetical protein
MPLKRIAAEVGVSVSTVHLWTRDIVLTPDQAERNRTGPGAPQNPEWIAKRAESWSETNRNRRRAFQEEGRAAARLRDPLHRGGCMLYWAEGAKSRNRITFCNSDPEMIRYFAAFLRCSLTVAEDRFSLRLNVYLGNGLTIGQVEAHWLKLLDLPRSTLRKHAINHFPTSSSGGRKNRLPYGVCTLAVARSTREVQHIYGAIQEYAGFEAPGWLDGPARS